MSSEGFNVVTGAFGCTGKHIARMLLSRGEKVRTLTDHFNRPNPFGNRIEIAPYRFDDPNRLTENLKGAHTVFNTYWVRFEHGAASFEQAVENSRLLIECASAAKVRRFVHISITHPLNDPRMPYFMGKYQVEELLSESHLSYAVIRPTVLFGEECILFNNIAWLLRKLPLFAIPGDGGYRLQPVHVADVAALALQLAATRDRIILDAAGPEIFTFNELVRLIRAHVSSRSLIFRLPAGVVSSLCGILGYFLKDVLLTCAEMRGLMVELLISENSPQCTTRFSDWLIEYGDKLGTAYFSELVRHYQ